MAANTNAYGQTFSLQKKESAMTSPDRTDTSCLPFLTLRIFVVSTVQACHVGAPKPFESMTAPIQVMFDSGQRRVFGQTLPGGWSFTDPIAHPLHSEGSYTQLSQTMMDLGTTPCSRPVPPSQIAVEWCCIPATPSAASQPHMYSGAVNSDVLEPRYKPAMPSFLTIAAALRTLLSSESAAAATAATDGWHQHNRDPTDSR